MRYGHANDAARKMKYMKHRDNKNRSQHLVNPKGDNDNNLLDDEMDMEEIEDDMPDVQEYH